MWELQIISQKIFMFKEEMIVEYKKYKLNDYSQI